MKLNVLSLFDGMSCGRFALEDARIKVDKYYSSEIDKYAIQVSENNFPDIIRLGDVTKWRKWDLDWASIDLFIGGSPCQGFSFAGKQLAFDDPRSALFFTFVDILNHVKEYNPNVKFMLENVRMKQEFLDVISDQVGVEPVKINSNLVSAQNRIRYYWANWDFEQPEDRGIFLKDVLEGSSSKEKSQTILATIYKENAKSMIKRNKQGLLVRDKSKCVRSGGRGSYDRHEWDSVDKEHLRKVTVLECERLQTVPDNSTAGVSNTQRYKILGNGWNMKTISHIFKALKQPGPDRNCGKIADEVSRGDNHVIVAAANKKGDKIFAGVRHCCYIMQSQMNRDEDFIGCEEGFIDNKYNFLDRLEAWKIAEKAGQIKYRCGSDTANGGTLYSENLW